MKKQSKSREYMRYMLLNVSGMLGLSCYILADTFFVSKGLGTHGLAALNLALPVYSVVNGSGLMLGMGGATRYSIFKGQKFPENANRAFTNTVYVAVVLAVVFIVTGLFASKRLTALLGADVEVFEMTNTYLKVILMFSPAFIMNNLFVCFVRNDGSPQLSMMAMLCGSFSNIILDYIFIFPLRMGIFGAVLATGCAPFISMSVLLTHKLKKRYGFHFVKRWPQPAMVLNIISLGFPSFITEVSSGIVMLAFNMLIWELEGNIGVAAYGVIANLSLVVLSIYTGIAQGMQPLVSKAYGVGDAKTAKQLLRYGIVTECLVSVSVYVLMSIFAGPITAVFNSEENMRLQEIAVNGIRLYFLSIPFAGLNIVLSSYFTSTEKTAPAHVISLLRGIILILPVVLLGAWIAGLTGVWLAVPITECVVCIMTLIHGLGSAHSK